MGTSIFHLKVTSSSSLEDLIRSVKKVLDEISEHRDGASVLVLECEHVDDTIEYQPVKEQIAAWEKVLRQIEMANCIIIYKSEGDVFGYSFDLLLIADYRIVRKGSCLGLSREMSDFPPSISLFRLANQVGQAQARKLSLAGKVLEADEAYQLGLADELSSDGAKAVNDAIIKYKNRSASELAICRRLLLEAHAVEYEDALGAYWAARARSNSRPTA